MPRCLVGRYFEEICLGTAVTINSRATTRLKIFTAHPISGTWFVPDPSDRRSHFKVILVKLDIEGAEFGALRGLGRRLERKDAPAVIFEFADWAEARIADQTPGDSQRYLMSRGYHLFRLGHKDALEVPLERALTTGSAMILALPRRLVPSHMPRKS